MKSEILGAKEALINGHARLHATQAINNGLASSVGAHAATAEGNAMIVYYQAALLDESDLSLAPQHGGLGRRTLGMGCPMHSRGAPQPLETQAAVRCAAVKPMPKSPIQRLATFRRRCGTPSRWTTT